MLSRVDSYGEEDEDDDASNVFETIFPGSFGELRGVENWFPVFRYELSDIGAMGDSETNKLTNSVCFCKNVG